MSTNQPVQAAQASGGGVPDARQLRTILIAVSIALMAVIASVTGLNVAQTRMAVEFGASQSTVLWIINVYTLALAALLLPLGAVGDRLGRKPMLIAGLGVFGIATVVAGLAPTAEVMLASRVASGIGAAMIMPITLAVITSTFPEEQRGKAIGVWTGVAGGGGILGMFLSALLVDVADWRWLFVLPVVLVLVALAMTVKSVPNSRETSAHRFDTVGALVSTVAVVGLIFVLQEGPERGWTAPETLISLAVGLIATVGFVAWELHRRDASLLDVRLFRERGLAGGSVTLLVVFGVQAGIGVVLFPFFQAVLGWSGLLSTVAMMPMAVMMMMASGLAPKIAARIGAYRADPDADYGPLNPVTRDKINLKQITAHWDEMLRLAGSLHSGTIKASEALRVLAPAGKPTPTGKAVMELGRLDRSAYLSSYFTDELLRRRVNTQLNRQESRHELARKVFHGQKGELRQSYREGQEDQLGALGLMLNIVVLWNTVYFQKIIAEMRAEGIHVRDEDIARLSPLKFAHINFHGRYSFALPVEVQGGQLRSTAKPDKTSTTI
jgi:MFS family permease